MERIWAPWRMEYIGKEKLPGCVFCEKRKSDRDAENYILYRGEKTFVILNLYPYNNGHLLIIPNRHAGEVGDLDDGELLELGQSVQKMTGVLKAAFRPDGFNIGVNLGNVAGAGVPGHFHIHIVPRWNGDTNFMPVLGDLKVIPEGLDATYKKLIETMNNIK